ncbi:unnamed protein product [Choristocarpus tenellus]
MLRTCALVNLGLLLAVLSPSTFAFVFHGGVAHLARVPSRVVEQHYDNCYDCHLHRGWTMMAAGRSDSGSGSGRRGESGRGEGGRTAGKAGRGGFGENVGGGRGGGRGRGRGRGRGGRGGSKAKSKGPGSPPRLEVVPPELVDEVYLCRERLPGRVDKVIEVYADRFAVVGGKRYIIGHPCDWAVSICIPTEDGVEPIPLDSKLMETLLPSLQRELEQDDVHLFNTPVTLTLQGEFVDEDEEDEDDYGPSEFDLPPLPQPPTSFANPKIGTAMWEGEEIEYEVISEPEGDEDDDEMEEVEENIPTDIDDVGVELIASYWHEEKEYALVKHLEPIFIIAREIEEDYELLGIEEANRVNTVVNRLMGEEIETTNLLEQELGKENLDAELEAAALKSDEEGTE